MSIELVRRFADLLPEATLIVSGGVIVGANRPAAKLMGRGPLELIDRPIVEFLADPPDAVADYLKACSKTREKVPGTLRPFDRAGRAVACRAEGAAFHPADDGAAALLMLRLVPKGATVSQFLALNQKIDALAREIHRRTQAEAELRRQREWLGVTLASIGDAVIATDTEGRVIFMNRVAEALTGWPQDDAAGHPLADVFRIVNEDTRLTVENPVTKALRVGAIVGLANHTILIARDGAEFSIDDTAAPIREVGGEILGVVLIFHDIGDRRQLERESRDRAERLVEADRRKDEFLAMLAHELRNPLASVKNAIHLLKMTDAAEHAEWAKEVIDRQVTHLARLIDDLLDVSRITRGKIELRQERIDATPVINGAVDAVRPLIEEKKQELATSFTPGTLWCEVDPTRLEQVLINLLTNAARYTGAGGHIRLTAHHDGDRVSFTVKDDGIGIPPAKLSEMFELFAQGDRTIARSEGGLGIGLTIVRRIAELHGGTATAFSEGPDCGSEFKVTLPAIPNPAPSTSMPSRGRPGRGGPTSRILVVDDNLDTARGLARLLKLIGHDVRTAHDGPAAIVEALAFRPEFVLLDIGLPGMDGYEVARQLRRGGFAESVIIAVSGYGKDEDRQLSREAGFNHHLVKPVDYDVLLSLISQPI